MIEIKQLSKIFEGEHAVEEVSLTVHKGSIFGLLGSNGAGKTTLLKTVAGIYRADRGQVLLEGQPIYEHPESKQRMIFLADQPYFFAQTSIQQMAVFYRAMYPNWDEQRFQQLAQAFKTIPLKRKLHRLSKGMQRQASLWLALSCKPDVLILDEPIDGLDPVMRRQVKNLIFQEVADRELTVIISSHNLREIEDMCDHVGIMHQGRLLIEKELDDLKAASHKIQIAFRDPRHEQAISGLLDILHKEERGSVGTYIIKGTVERITEVVQAYQPYVFDVLPMTLEEIFIYEMGDAGYDVQPLLL
ncbi:ABC transporter ATP-binding protein [Paenibacillus shenyangensis]|uniref:ABC transporter ATP-binding protein n=1 Tax=Paenibacillus sp. A9 TaxID=1284352 RepID=UPI00037C98C2|nr:ABC transporter ATP-binding protein [Paenibacillus sp. A9]